MGLHMHMHIRRCAALPFAPAVAYLCPLRVSVCVCALQAARTGIYETCGGTVCDGRVPYVGKDKACPVCPGGVKAAVECAAYVLECTLRNGESVTIKFQGALAAYTLLHACKRFAMSHRTACAPCDTLSYRQYRCLHLLFVYRSGSHKVSQAQLRHPNYRVTKRLGAQRRNQAGHV